MPVMLELSFPLEAAVVQVCLHTDPEMYGQGGFLWMGT